MVGMSLKWLEGTRNKNTRRITYEIPVKTGDYSNYDEVIDKVLPVVDKMKKVCEYMCLFSIGKRVKNNFPDFIRRFRPVSESGCTLSKAPQVQSLCPICVSRFGWRSSRRERSRATSFRAPLTPLSVLRPAFCILHPRI